MRNGKAYGLLTKEIHQKHGINVLYYRRYLPRMEIATNKRYSKVIAFLHSKIMIHYFTFTSLSSTSAGLPSSKIAPTNHAGHHTHQTTTWVFIPQTSHPNAASCSISPIPKPQNLLPASKTVMGVSACTRTERIVRMIG